MLFPLYLRGDNALTQPDFSVSDKLDQYVGVVPCEDTRRAVKEDVIVLESVAMGSLFARFHPVRTGGSHLLDRNNEAT